MLYDEPVPGKIWYFGVLLLFLVMYLPHLGTRELQTAEALQATVAQGMIESGDFQATRIHNRSVTNVFPLYPWLICATSRFQTPNEWTVRLPAAVAVLLLALLCGRAAALAGGHLAGAVAAGMVIASLGLLDAGRQARVEIVAAGLLSAAWFFWYRLGRIYKYWGLAWAVGLALALAAFFGIGITAFVMFYFPLLFLRRPLRIWRRFLVLPHFLMLGAIGLFLIYWYRLNPGHTFFSWQTLISMALPRDTGSYFHHLLTFPLACAWELMPWSWLAWPAFCAAFRPVEKTPIFCRYLRTLILPLWLAAWLLPGTTPMSLLPVIGPLAVLTGLHYAILLRRHYQPLLLLLRFLEAGGIGLAVAILVLFLLHVAGVLVFSALNLSAALLMAGPVLIMLLCLAWQRRRWQSQPYWIRFMLAMAALQVIVLSIGPLYRSHYFECRRDNGRNLAAGLPEPILVYKLFEPSILPIETFYLRRPVREIASTAELPPAEPAVFVLAGVKPPIMETRTWTPCSEPVNYRARIVPLVGIGSFRTGLFRVDPAVSLPADGTKSDVVRLYRGDLRHVVKEIPGVLNRPSEPVVPAAGK